MKGALSEKAIENQILGWLRAHDVFGFKVKSMGTYDPSTGRFRAPSKWYRKGCPDILCCIRGLFLGLEVKAARGVVSDHQRSFHEDIRNAGGKIFVVRSIEDVEEALKPYLEAV